MWILSLFMTCIQLQIHPARDCDTDIKCLLFSFLFFSFLLFFFLFFFISSFFFIFSFFVHFFFFFLFFFRSFFLRWITADPSPWGNFTGETIVWRDPGGSWACLWPVSNYQWINSPSQRLWHRYNVSSSSSFLLFFLFLFFIFFSAGRFSYGESPRTPPLEGTSLHRRNNSVERPWGILSLFTTCLQLWVN